MTDFEAQVLRDLGALGRLNELESRVASHERSVQGLKGIVGAMGVLLTVAHVVVTWWAEKR